MSIYKIHPQAIEDAPAPIIKKVSKILWDQGSSSPVVVGDEIFVEITHPWLGVIDGAEICLFKSKKSYKKYYIDGEKMRTKSSRKFRFRKVLEYHKYSYQDFCNILDYLYINNEGYNNCDAAIAIRYPNPDFFKHVNPNKELKDNTTMIHVDGRKIPRYIISKYVLLKVCANDSSGIEGFGIRNICI